jgi:hypothetical protein
MGLEVLASMLASPTLPAISNGMVNFLSEFGEDVVAKEFSQANASIGTSFVFAYTDNPKDLAGISIGIEGTGLLPKSSAISLGGSYARGWDVHQSRLNGAWSLSAGFEIGVSASIEKVTNTIDGFIAVSVPNNMPDYKFPDDL